MLYRSLCSRRSVLLCLAALAAGLLGGCSGRRPAPPAVRTLPSPGSPAYEQTVTHFNSGVISLETGAKIADAMSRAADELVTASQTAPGEPAIWADLSIARSKSTDLSGAEVAVRRAESLAPNSAPIQMIYGELLGIGKLNRGPESLAHLRRAVELAPGDARTHYALANEEELQSNFGSSPADALTQWRTILDLQPDNVFAAINLAVTAAQLSDGAQLRAAISALARTAPTWPEDARRGFTGLQAAASGSAHNAPFAAMTLRNLMKPVVGYQRGEAMLSVDRPIERFLVLANPASTPAPPDTQLAFTPEPLQGAPAGRWALARVVVLRPEMPADLVGVFRNNRTPVVAAPEGPPVTLLASRAQVQIVAPNKTTVLTFPGGGVDPAPEGVTLVDYNYDFRPDVALAGAGGLRLYRQTQGGDFTDVTAASRLPAAVTSMPLTGAWAADVDEDGDLDLVLAPREGPVLVARNNQDGTWTPIHPFPGAPVARQIVWADVTGDGVPDASMLDSSGRLVIYKNRLGGQFQPLPPPEGLGKLLAIGAGDLDRDGFPDLLALKSDGAIVRITRNEDNTGWQTATVATWPNAPSDGSARLLCQDLDNNGGLDLIATGSKGTQVWLSNERGALAPLPAAVAVRAADTVVPSREGRLDLVGVDARGGALRAMNQGSQSYHWQDLRPRSYYVARTNHGLGTGAQRINSFGIGGLMEIRCGLLTQTQTITGPCVHFGMGAHTTVDAVREIWPNLQVDIRSEFALRPDQMFVAEQRLGGSCPWLFAWDGHKMRLVTDCIWRSPLGLKINAQDTAGVSQTQDWVKIRGDQLVPHDGYYDLRITAELNETHFFDYLALMTVDHPRDTEIYVDERFCVPPPKLQVIATTPAKPVAKAVDDLGNDVTDIVRARDGRYLDTFGRGAYQGITRDHWVELTLGKDADAPGPLYLIGTGWIHPTDSSINVAISQGHHDPPRGLSIEVPNGRGGWRVARPSLGFPEGKIKTVTLDLTGLWKPGEEKRLRLRTNLEIYWDFLGYAHGLPSAPLLKQRLLPSGAELRYRGFSVATTADASSPEIPDYDHLSAITPRWVDLEGYYTRFGDVRPLLRAIDDRYVIMNAGDELALRFLAVPAPPAGWTRDYVLIGDGWEKDGNVNTTFSRTVLPLPAHSQTTYTTPPGALEDDPVYRKHPQDWQDYHTRYVTPRPFLHALQPVSSAAR